MERAFWGRFDTGSPIFPLTGKFMDKRRGMVYNDSVLVLFGREALTSERKAAELLAKLLAERTGVRTLATDDHS
jgi:hypothetical protein